MFPIKDMSGRIIAFGGRVLPDAAETDAAKYINSPESSLYKKGDNLYGLFQARKSITEQKSVLLTEGYMDVLTLHQYGYCNACGVLGTALTREQVKRLGFLASTLELVFDGDAAGRKAAMRGAEMILCQGFNCKVIILPDKEGNKEDIDSLLKGQGGEAFESLRALAPDALTYCMRVLNRDFAPRQIMDWVLGFLLKVEQEAFRPKYVGELARGLGLSEYGISKELEAKLKDARPAAVPSAPARADSDQGLGGEHDKQLLNFILHCPRYLPALEQKGLVLALRTSRGRRLWEKMRLHDACAAEKDFLSALLEDLEGDDKDFCILCLEHVPPPAQEKAEREFAQLCESIEKKIRKEFSEARLQTMKNAPLMFDEMLKAKQATVSGPAE